MLRMLKLKTQKEKGVIRVSEIFLKDELEDMLHFYYNPGVRLSAARRGDWHFIKALLIRSLLLYGEPIPYWLNDKKVIKEQIKWLRERGFKVKRPKEKLPKGWYIWYIKVRLAKIWDAVYSSFFTLKYRLWRFIFLLRCNKVCRICRGLILPCKECRFPPELREL